MKRFEEKYKDLLFKIITSGSLEKNRTGVDCLTLFSEKIQFDLSSNLMPVVTGKKIFYSKAYHEAHWIYKGNTSVKYLNENGIDWWNDYADENGNVHKSYGYQLRNWNGSFDQISYVVWQIIKGSRRAHMSFWNPNDQNDIIPCCYTGMTFVVTGKGKTLNASVSFRSSDTFLGLPYDFIVLAIIHKAIATESGLNVGTISYCLENAHVYVNHVDQVKEYLKLPIFDLPYDSFSDKVDYKSGPYIPAKLNN